MPGGVQVSCLKSHSKVSGGGFKPRKFHCRGESTLEAQTLPTCFLMLYGDPKIRANIFHCLQGKLEGCDTWNVKMLACGQSWEGDTLDTLQIDYG